MKNRIQAISLLLIMALSSSTLWAQNENSSMQKLSENLGMLMGTNIKSQFDNIDIESFTKGIQYAIDNDIPDSILQQANMFISQEMQKMQEDKYKGNIAEGEAFLAKNKQKDGVMETESGLQYEVVQEGTGAKPKATDKVKVHYHGTLIDGTVFDSSVDRGEPISFPLNGVIKGWQEGLQLMPVGSKYKFYIPHDLAYGERGAGEQIKPYSTLIFEVELLGIE